MEEEREFYGVDILEKLEGDIEVGLDGEPGGLHAATDEVAFKELKEMKKRLKEMEEEALRNMQSKVERKMSAVQDSDGKDVLPASREEANARSVFVG